MVAGRKCSSKSAGQRVRYVLLSHEGQSLIRLSGGTPVCCTPAPQVAIILGEGTSLLGSHFIITCRCQ